MKTTAIASSIQETCSFNPVRATASHDLAIDRHGTVYVAEVVATGGGNVGVVSLSRHSLQKFVLWEP